MTKIFTNSKGGLIGSLCYLFLSINLAGQSFFFAETSASSVNFGEIRTTQLPEEIANRLRESNLNQQEWSSFFNLKTESSNPAVLGDYSVRNNQIVFTPRFLPDPSISYIISFSNAKLNSIFDTSLNNEIFTEKVNFSAIDSKEPEVVSISPDLTTFPENILRIYVEFNSPMSFENPYHFISIKNNQGEQLVEPFVIIPEGLWNIDRTRLTILFHPGRIKRGVGPNMTEGDILENGKKYIMEISKEWKGSSGKTLNSSFQKSFTVSYPLREKINFIEWDLIANEDGVLYIKTLHPLDQVLAKRMLFIKAKEGDIQPSRVEFISAYQLRITWSKQSVSEYELIIDPRLEDICGNNPLNAFDYESGNLVTSKEMLKRSFSID